LVESFSPRPTDKDTLFFAIYAPIHDVVTPLAEYPLRGDLSTVSRCAIGYAKVTHIASAASGDANPRARISFLLSKKIVPLESGFIMGEIRSLLSSLSDGIEADFNQVRISPHISARLLPYIS
jgi:hypothetical protein